MSRALEFYKKNFQSSLNKKVQEKILNDLNKSIQKDIVITINKNFYPKHTLYLFHLINDYHQAYVKSTESEQKSRINKLESLGKGNLKRTKRYNKNEEDIKNKSLPLKRRLKAIYENMFLSRIIKGDYKFAYLILTAMFMYKPLLNNIFKLLFNRKQTVELVESFNESLEFFEFTYLSPTKIVNSCAISLYQYLKHCTDINDKEKQIKFVRDIINVYFSEHAPNKIRHDSFNKEIYCAGIYNGTPIFQWHTSTINEHYYTNKDLKKYSLYAKKSLKEIGTLKHWLITYLTKDRNSKKYNFESKDEIKKIINNLSITYVKQPPKLMEVIHQNQQKTIKYYIFAPIRLISTILTRSITKSALK